MSNDGQNYVAGFGRGGQNEASSVLCDSDFDLVSQQLIEFLDDLPASKYRAIYQPQQSALLTDT